MQCFGVACASPRQVAFAPREEKLVVVAVRHGRIFPRRRPISGFSVPGQLPGGTLI